MDEAGFGETLDDAVNWDNGEAYFFKGDHYIGYNIDSDSVDEGPIINRRELGWNG